MVIFEKTWSLLNFSIGKFGEIDQIGLNFLTISIFYNSTDDREIGGLGDLTSNR